MNTVTEQEMSSFFERVVTSFVSLSQQAEELKQLREHVEQLTQDFSNIKTEAAQLREDKARLEQQVEGMYQQLDEANTRQRTAEGDTVMATNRAEKAERDAAQAKDELDALRNVMVQRDQCVQELEAQVRELWQANNAANAESEQRGNTIYSLRQNIEDQNHTIESLREDVRSLTQSRAEAWRERDVYKEAYDEIHDTVEKLKQHFQQQSAQVVAFGG